MSKKNGGHARGKYTLEFKRQAVRLVAGGQAVPVTAKVKMERDILKKATAYFARQSL